MKKICTSLREHATNVVNFEKKKNLTLNKRRTKIISKCKSMSYLWEKNLKKVFLMIKKVKVHCHCMLNKEVQHKSIFNYKFNVAQ